MNRSRNKHKVFCIGVGKTGTTSMEKVLMDFGYKMGDQIKAEMLLDEYARRNFSAIINFCKNADAFQDAPFCFKYTFIALDQYFLNSKFILTIRDSDEQWYNSLLQFHTRTVTSEGKIPTWEDLKNSEYRYKGYRAEVRKKVFGLDESEDPYDERKLKAFYNSHNDSVLDYFKYKDNLLVVNVAEADAYQKLCVFLNKKPLYDVFPWRNKTSEK